MNWMNCVETHDPSDLREQFQEWLDFHEPNRLKEIDIRSVASMLDALSTCGDVLPADYCDQLEIPKGSTYTEAVADVRQFCTEQQRQPVETETPDLAWIKRMADDAAKQFGLDYSLDSLAKVDSLLGKVGDCSDSILQKASLTFGCYVGEVLVHHADGEWVQDETLKNAMGTVWIVEIRSPRHITVSPLTRCTKRIKNGENDGVEMWGRYIVAMHRQDLEAV